MATMYGDDATTVIYDKNLPWLRIHFGRRHVYAQIQAEKEQSHVKV